MIVGGDHIGAELDVSISEQVYSVVDRVIQKYSQPPTVIVNAAGITMDNFIWKMSEENFDRVISVNLKVKHTSH